MSTPSMAAAPQPVAGELAPSAKRAITLSVAASVATLLSVLGTASIFSAVVGLWTLWTTDPLKSIGGFIPFVSLALILLVWRSIGWEMDGTWWGLVLLIGTIALVDLRDHAILELVLAQSWTILIPPYSLVAFCYAASFVLFFGGTRLFRAALFPIVLMGFANPVPHMFNTWVDLPLQHTSALIARGFAQALGQPLTHDQLRLMFTPDFGMFIAPGCNGIRGAVTMGFIALIAGYIYRFRSSIHALVVACAVLLGYVFNFARLCLLVVYYIIALHIPWLQSRAKMGDYIIGACLFFFATMFLFSVIRRFNPSHDFIPPSRPKPQTQGILAPQSFFFRSATLLLVLLLGSVTYIRAFMQQRESPQAVTNPNALGIFPQQIGSYQLQRRWNEYLNTGRSLMYHWADYRPAAGGPVVSVGVYPVFVPHDTLICHAARGDDWLWHGDLIFPTIAGDTSFSSSFFKSGVSQSLEATTICTGVTCGQYTDNRKHFGLVYSRPDTQTLLTQNPAQPILLLLRVETVDTQMSAESARSMLTASLGSFLADAKISSFTQPYRQPQ